MYQNDTIIALATPSGAGAIAVIRLSGSKAIAMVDASFKSISTKKLVSQKTHTIHLGHVVEDSRVLDEVLVSVFKNPKSYTGEDVVEISCHGSSYIQQEIIQLFVRNGARIANPGEFTLRAFLNAKLDLSQAEAVADLIASDNKASHQIAMQQMRGGFSNEIKVLRDELLNFASLIELELDFSEEDVEFANRKQFEELLERIIKVLKHLIDSFSTGNVIKNGIPISIIGAPNVGKSTLLNDAAGAGAGLIGGGIHAQIFGEQTSALFWLAIFILVCGVCGLNLKGKISTGKTVLLCMVFMALGGGLTALGGGLMQWGWAVFHILVITLQAFIFMVLTVVYLSMAHEDH